MKTDFIEGKFTDYKGDERDFTIAAVSFNGIDVFDDVEFKVLHLGISVRTSDDEHDADLGKRIAEGKAIKNPYDVVTSTSSGLINSKVVRAILESEAEFFKENPGKYITGYNKRKAKYEEGLYFDTVRDSLSTDEKQLYGMILDKPERVEEITELAEYDLEESKK